MTAPESGKTGAGVREALVEKYAEVLKSSACVLRPLPKDERDRLFEAAIAANLHEAARWLVLHQRAMLPADRAAARAKPSAEPDGVA